MEPQSYVLCVVTRNKRALLVLLMDASSYAGPGIHDLPQIIHVVAEAGPYLWLLVQYSGHLGKAIG